MLLYNSRYSSKCYPYQKKIFYEIFLIFTRFVIILTLDACIKLIGICRLTLNYFLNYTNNNLYGTYIVLIK